MLCQLEEHKGHITVNANKQSEKKYVLMTHQLTGEHILETGQDDGRENSKVCSALVEIHKHLTWHKR
jgi:hypothetical protein